ncbi:hypothetical protein [Amycolatopsis sp. NPDC051102]|uniref:hypothetical protein n=1 Tax=Amycolatopsis sp. NPDC051102 TaxID=3155163 RepID=UPI0034447371
MVAGWLGWDWGNVPAWTGTVLTSGSLATAALAYRRSVRDKEREQAGKIAVWTSPGEGEERRLLIANHSDLAVYSLTIKPFEAEIITLTRLEPGQPEERLLPGYDRAILGRKHAFRFGSGPVDATLAVDRIAEEPLPEMTFRDAAGHWWRRNGQGKLLNSRPREPITPSLGIDLFGVNVAVLAFDSGDRKWRLGRNRQRPDDFIGARIYEAVNALSKLLHRQLRKRDGEGVNTEGAAAADEDAAGVEAGVQPVPAGEQGQVGSVNQEETALFDHGRRQAQ